MEIYAHYSQLSTQLYLFVFEGVKRDDGYVDIKRPLIKIGKKGASFPKEKVMPNQKTLKREDLPKMMVEMVFEDMDFTHGEYLHHVEWP